MGDHIRQVDLLAMMQHTAGIAYDTRRSVDERFNALMLLHYTLWGVTHTTGDAAAPLRQMTRDEVARFARRCVSPGSVGVGSAADGTEVVRAGALGEFPVIRRDEATGERGVEIPYSVLVWLTSALAAEFKLPDLRSGEPGTGD